MSLLIQRIVTHGQCVQLCPRYSAGTNRPSQPLRCRIQNFYVVCKGSAAQSSAVSGSTGTSGNASLSEAAYEGEVKALVQQLYAVKGRAEGGLNACIASAKAEYKSLPPEQQTRSRKIAICMSKAGQLSALQASCDSEVNRIVSQMRSVLKANGQSTALADQAMSSYKSQKSARRAALMSQLYG